MYVLTMRMVSQRQHEFERLVEKMWAKHEEQVEQKQAMTRKQELEAQIGFHLGKAEELRKELNDYEVDMPEPAEEIPADGKTYWLLIGDDKDVIVPIVAGRNPKFDEKVWSEKQIFFETKEDAKRYLGLL